MPTFSGREPSSPAEGQRGLLGHLLVSPLRAKARGNSDCRQWREVPRLALARWIRRVPGAGGEGLTIRLGDSLADARDRRH